MEADPDRALVERCRHDDANALRELLERYKDSVYGPISSVTPNPAQAEQLAADVFLRVHRNLPYFRGEASVRTWILRTAAEVCPPAFPAGTAGQAPASEARRQSPSAQFVTRTLGTMRRVSWRREQLLDIAFNVVIGVVGLATVGLAWYFLDASGLAVIGGSSMTTVTSQVEGLARSVAPSVPGYLAAAGLIAAVLLAWWWAER